MKTLFLIQLLKKGILASILLSIISCNFLSNDSQTQNNIEANQKDGYIVQPNYDHPKFKELDRDFTKQEHRFEIDRCEFKYNDQAFFIGDSYDKIIEIFGKPDDELVFTPNKKSYSIRYADIKLFFRFIPSDNSLKTIVLYIGNLEQNEDITIAPLAELKTNAAW